MVITLDHTNLSPSFCYHFLLIECVSFHGIYIFDGRFIITVKNYTPIYNCMLMVHCTSLTSVLSEF